VLVHHHASQVMVRGTSIEDILGGASGTRVIRIDGSTLSGGDGLSLGKAENSDDDIVDEIVRALQVQREKEDDGWGGGGGGGGVVRVSVNVCVCVCV
jgi:hypothetical protein